MPSMCDAVELTCPLPSRNEIPTSAEVQSAMRDLFFRLRQRWLDSSGYDLPRSTSLLVWADDLARARVRQFGQRLDDRVRITARQSVDLEVTEAIRMLAAEDEAWPGPLWVCTGPQPAAWSESVDAVAEIRRTDAESSEDMDEIDAAVWFLTVTVPDKTVASSPRKLASGIELASCTVRSVLGPDLADHRSAFQGESDIALQAAPSAERWVGSAGLADAHSVEHALTQAVQTVLDQAQVDPDEGVVLLGAAQYTSGADEPSSAAGFGAPAALTLDRRGTAVRMPLYGVSHACASVLYAIDLAQYILTLPRIRTVVITSASMENPAAEASMRAVRAVSPTAARPFSPDRDGITLGAGAGALLLRRPEPGAPPALARVIGSGTRVGAPTASSQEVGDVLNTLRAAHSTALASADGAAGKVMSDVVVAHATGTPVGDPVELEAVSAFIRCWGHEVPMVSHKGATGHLLHASGLLGIAHAVSLLGRARIAGTWGLERAPQAGPVRVIPAGAAYVPGMSVRTVAVNALGFGGNTATVVLGAA